MISSVVNKSALTIALISLFLTSFFSIQSVLAQNFIPNNPEQASNKNTNLVAPTVSLESPLKNIATIDGLLVAILNIIIILMIPIIVFFIILAGFKYVTARGNATQVQEATRALTYAIIGGVLILGAVALSQIIANVVQSF